MTTATNYSPTAVFGNTSDIGISETGTLSPLISAASLTLESFSALSGTGPDTVINKTTGAGNSTLTLGNSAGFTNGFSAVANDLIYVNTTGSKPLTIQGAPGSTGTGTLGLVLASGGNFDIAGNGSLIISSVISSSIASTPLAITGISGGGVVGFTSTTGNTFTGNVSVTGAELDVTLDSQLGNSNNTLSINGGRLSTASITTARTILLGNAANTSISVTGTNTTTDTGPIQNVTGLAGTLVKQGGGTLTLSSTSNSYTGGTFINNGKILLSTNANVLPTSTTVSVGQSASTNLGTLDLGGLNLQIAGLNSTVGTNALTTTSNTVTSSIAGTPTLLIFSTSGNSNSFGSNSTTNSGVITGALSIGINLTNGGSQIFGGANTYTGTTTIANGTLSTGTTGTFAPEGNGTSGTTASSIGQSNNAASNLVFNGGTLQFANATTAATTDRLFTLGANGGTLDASGTGTSSAATLTFSNTGPIAVSGTTSLKLTGSNTSNNTLTPVLADFGGNATSSLSKTGAGNWVLAGVNTYTGGTTISNGTLTVGSAGSLGTGTLTMAQSSTNNTTLTFSNSTQSVSNLTSTFTATSGTQSQTINLNGSGTSGGGTSLSITQTANTSYGAGNASTLTSLIAGIGSVTLASGSTGTLTLTGANTYSGATTISAGTLQLGDGTSDGSIANTSGVTDNGTLIYNLANADRTLVNYAIAGTGTVNLVGRHTLFVNTSIGGSNTVNINSGTLAGNGTVAGPVMVASGATLATGGAASSIAAFSVGTVNLAAANPSGPTPGATFVATLNSATNNVGTLAVANTAAFGTSDPGQTVATSTTGALLSVIDLGANTATPGSVFTIVTAGSLVTGGFSNLSTINAYVNGVPFNFPDAIAAANGDVFTVTFNDANPNATGGPDNITLTVDATPEPASLSLVAFGGLALLRRRRKVAAHNA